MKSYSQDYSHLIGVKADYGVFIEDTELSSLMTVIGIEYSGILVFGTDEGAKFAISGRPFIGYNPVGGSYGLFASLGLELPLLAELYFGDIRDRNFNLGAGISLAHIVHSNSWTGTHGGLIIGPQLAIGGQTTVAGRLASLRLSYTYGVNDRLLEDEFGNEAKFGKHLIGFSVSHLLGQ